MEERDGEEQEGGGFVVVIGTVLTRLNEEGEVIGYVDDTVSIIIEEEIEEAFIRRGGGAGISVTQYESWRLRTTYGWELLPSNFKLYGC